MYVVELDERAGSNFEVRSQLQVLLPAVGDSSRSAQNLKASIDLFLAPQVHYTKLYLKFQWVGRATGGAGLRLQMKEEGCKEYRISSGDTER